MQHLENKEKILKSILGELSQEEIVQLKKHLVTCAECAEEYRIQFKLRELLDRSFPEQADELLLNEARNELKVLLRHERSKSNIIKKFTEFLIAEFSVKRTISYAFILLFGITTGYFIFGSRENLIPIKSFTENVSDQALQGDVRINNVSFIDADASDGIIEFTFEAIKPVKLKGNINDAQIQNVLLYSMLNEQNPGVRLNSINAVGSESKILDDELKEALLYVIRFDKNPGVRGEALKLFKQTKLDEDIKDALLFVLTNDSSSALRIEALNIIIDAGNKGQGFSDDELKVLKNKMVSDENDYIRYRAKTVLEEIQ